MGGVVVGGRLRSRLLVGVAALAMAAPASTRALAQSVDKWQPYLEAGGLVGNDHSLGDVDIFLPLWQDQTSLFFGDLRGTFTTSPSQEGNFGLGYRTQLNTDWILGGWGYIDIQNSKNSNLFYQGSLGAELLSVDWDFRLNGYLPFNGGGQTVSGGNGTSGHLGIFGNNFGFQTNDVKKEYALYGFDGEVGWRVPVFPVDGDMDLRVFAGGYYFARGDVDTIAGPRGRIEARLYDIDFLGLQSRLTVQGIVQWDQPRGTQGFGGLELRIPLGIVTGSTGPKLNPLDRRMVDRVQRDLDIVTETATKKGSVTLQEVQVDELTVHTHTAVFADGMGTDGDPGTQKHPTDLNNAPSLGQALGSNAVIIAQGNRGDLNVTNPVQLSNGQALIGGGSVVPLTLIGGKHNGEIVDFSFPGTRPTVVGDNASVNLIDMAKGSQNRITGLDLTGSFSNGIFGSDMYRAIITNNSIGGAAGNGILLTNAIDPDPAVVPHSAFVDIRYNTIVGSGQNGVAIETYIGPADHSSHTQTIRITYNSIGGNTSNGVFISNFANGAGSQLSQSLDIFSNLVTGNHVDGMRIANRAQSSGGVSEIAFIFGNTVTGNTASGIVVDNYASFGGAVFQGGAIGFNIVDNNTGGDGIRLTNKAQSSGNIFQFVQVIDNTVTSNGANGISLRNYVQSIAGGEIQQIALLYNNTATHNRFDGLAIFNEARTGGAIFQGVGVSGGTFSYNTADGIFSKNFAFGAGTLVSQFAGVSNVVVTKNSADGIALDNFATSGGATVLQTVVIDPTTVTSNGRNGIYGRNELTSATISQHVEVLNDIVSFNTSNGIRFNNTGSGAGGQLSQTVVVSGSVITNNGRDGFSVRNRFYDSAGLSQDISIAASTIAENSSHGVFISSSLYGTGPFTQGVSILSSRIVSNPGGGIDIKTFGSSSASVTEFVTIGGNVVSYNGSNGIEVKDQVTNGSTLSQTVSITGNLVNFNSSRGIDVRAIGYSSSTVVQNVLVGGNTVTHNGSDGIRVKAVEGPQGGVVVGGSLTQTVVVSGNSVDHSSKNGIYIAASAASVTTFAQNVTVAGNRVTSSALSNGIAIITSLDTVSNPATEILSVTNNFVKYTGSDGIFVHTTLTGSGTTLTQTSFAINQNTVTSVPGIGIFVSNDIAAGTTLSQGSIANHATINDNTVSYADIGGIIVSNSVVGAGASLAQVLDIDPNTVRHVGYDGIFVHTLALSGAVAVQKISIDGNTVTDVEGQTNAVGIGVLNEAGDTVASATISQSLGITDNTVTFVAASATGIVFPVAAGIYVRNSAGLSAHISQSAFIATNTISAISGLFIGAGILNVNEAAQSGAVISQTVGINDNTVSYVIGFNAAGIGNINDVSPGATISQALTIDPNTVRFIGGNDSVAHATYAVGILVQNRVASNGVFSQTANILSNHVTDIQASSHAAGIVVATYLSRGAVVTGQAISIGGNFVSHVAASEAVGIAVLNQVGDSLGGGDLSQTLAITGNSVTHVASAGEDGSAIGVYVSNFAGLNGHISQSAVISTNTVTYISVASNGHFAGGIVNVNDAAQSGAGITQTVGINDNTVTHIAGLSAFGIANINDVTSGATVSQALTIDPNTVAFIGGTNGNFGAEVADGILVSNNVGPNALLSQSVDIVGNHVSNISGYIIAGGIVVDTLASGTGSIVSQTVNIGAASGGGNTVTSVAAAFPIFDEAVGIGVFTTVSDGASATQTVNVLANTVKTISGPIAAYANGIVVYNRATYAVISQALVVAQNSVNNVSGDGIRLINQASGEDGFISQTVAVGSAVVGTTTFGGNVVTNAGYDGIKLHNTAEIGAVVSQTGSVADNFVGSNGGIGIGSLNRASGGFIADVYQSLTITNNTAQRNILAGFSFGVSVAGGFLSGNYASEFLTMTSNTAKRNGVGLDFKAYGSNAQQVVNLTSANVVQTNGVGVNIYASDAVQTVFLHTGNNTFGPNLTNPNINVNVNGTDNQNVVP